jgi:hypothetical protein
MIRHAVQMACQLPDLVRAGAGHVDVVLISVAVLDGQDGALRQLAGLIGEALNPLVPGQAVSVRRDEDRAAEVEVRLVRTAVAGRDVGGVRVGLGLDGAALFL